MKVLNAEEKVLGRFASEVARHAKDGEEVFVVNSEEAVISGDESEIKEEYETRYERGRRDTGPYFPKRADKILKRTIRNMLPDGPDGRGKRSNVKTFLGVPERFEEEVVEEVEVKRGDELKHRNYVKLGEVSQFIGGGK